MKTAIYVEKGITELILTPENQFEKETIERIDPKHVNDWQIAKGAQNETIILKHTESSPKGGVLPTQPIILI
jgi:hypothetical protein